MDAHNFKKILRATHRSMMKLTESKGREYAGSNDQLANFKRLGGQLALPPEGILWVYLTKHLDSLSTYIREVGAGYRREYSEPITGRVDDAILYLMLLKALIIERLGLEIEEEAPEVVEAPGGVCPKHGCVLTQTITDDVFCGVCEVHRLKQVVDLLRGRTVDSLQKEIRAWADSVFPNRTAQHALNKLVMDEIPEFLHGGLGDPLEYADLVILILDIADRKGIDVAKAVHDKMAINRKRVWKVDEETGRAQHIGEDVVNAPRGEANTEVEL